MPLYVTLHHSPVSFIISNSVLSGTVSSGVPSLLASPLKTSPLGALTVPVTANTVEPKAIIDININKARKRINKIFLSFFDCLCLLVGVFGGI